MKVQFLYFEDCPSHEDGLARLQQAMREIGVESEIEIVKVETDEQARNGILLVRRRIWSTGRTSSRRPSMPMPA
jgi:hypothetical protein